MTGTAQNNRGDCFLNKGGGIDMKAKTKEQLIEEIESLRKEVAELEQRKSNVGGQWSCDRKLFHQNAKAE